MTAHRVIDSHSELEDIGSLSHSQLDAYINTSPFVVANTGGLIPAAARKIIAGSNVTVTDTGAGGNIIIAATGGGGGSGFQIIWNDIPSGSIDGINSTFTLSYTPSQASALALFYEGQKLKQGLDYTLSGPVITTLTMLRSGSWLDATYPAATTSSPVSWNETPTGDVDGVNMVFTLANTPTAAASVMLFYEGQKLKQGFDYDVFGTTITTLFSLRSGSWIEATYPY